MHVPKHSNQKLANNNTPLKTISLMLKLPMPPFENQSHCVWNVKSKCIKTCAWWPRRDLDAKLICERLKSFSVQRIPKRMNSNVICFDTCLCQESVINRLCAWLGFVRRMENLTLFWRAGGQMEHFSIQFFRLEKWRILVYNPWGNCIQGLASAFPTAALIKNIGWLMECLIW